MNDLSKDGNVWFRWKYHLGNWQGQLYYDFVPGVQEHNKPYFGPTYDVSEMKRPNGTVSLDECERKFPTPKEIK